MYADVLTEITSKKLDKTFTYIIPSCLQNKVKIGSRVTIDFNKRVLEGFVLNIHNKNQSIKLKEIISLVDNEPILTKEMILLGEKMARTYLCSLMSSYQAMLPTALKAKSSVNMRIKKYKYLVLNKDEQEIKNYLQTCKYERQINILKELLIKKKVLLVSKTSSINTLINKELITMLEEELYRYKYSSSIIDKKVKLNTNQQDIVNQVINNLTDITYLLYGVTGSGKTEVYMNIIDKIITSHKQAIMLVPEISLTMQVVGLFKARFGDEVAIIHSGLSATEKYDEYRKIMNNKVKIVVGARSAIFVPFTNIGIIIIDEEHVDSYKQENNPKYHAKDIAIMRSHYHKCPVILGSATPTLESMARAKNNVYQLLELKTRVNNKTMPKVNIVDMKEEYKKKNTIFSSLLIEKIKDRLEKKEQVILLLNRRGYSSLITCHQCGYKQVCKNCDISLTYHKTSNMMRCHYCGYGTKRINVCPVCGSKDIKDYGIGTQQLEERLNKVFTTARIIRMDVDTTSKKGSHQKIIDDFSSNKYNILVGTQMIAKGLDFPNVTLVGVLNADMLLNLPDFRSAERTFQLLCQVAGRAGRGQQDGEVVIQTFNDNHYSITLAKKHDYDTFYKEEMNIRKKLKYSPYYFMTLLRISGKNYQDVSDVSRDIGKYLRNNISPTSIVLGPSMANVLKVNNIYYFQIIIKYRKDNNLKLVLKQIDERYCLDSKINIDIDINPIRL